MSTVTVKDEQVRKFLSELTKQTGRISSKSRQYVGLLSSIVIGDIIHHFETERGPQKRWAPWSQAYRESMIKRGKGANRILQDTGRLRGGWLPSRHRLSRDGILWYNPVPYASTHDEGTGRVPQRRFTWLSKSAITRLEKDTIKFLKL